MLLPTVFVLLLKGVLPESRIAGGEVARLGQFPYQVSLRNEYYKHYCGGSIISDYVVLTAAVCIYQRSPKKILAVVGSNILAPGGVGFLVCLTAHPEGFNPDTLRHNIGVLKTKARMLDIARTGVVALSKRSYPYPGDWCALSGWGKVCTSDSQYSNFLRFVYMSITSISDCQRAFPDQDIDSTLVCAFKEGASGCDGDNGDPFVRDGVQFGVLSWGIPGATDKPNVFTNVAAYAAFISKYV